MTSAVECTRTGRINPSEIVYTDRKYNQKCLTLCGGPEFAQHNTHQFKKEELDETKNHPSSPRNKL